jgi:hypothetical protein
MVADRRPHSPSNYRIKVIKSSDFQHSLQLKAENNMKIIQDKLFFAK